MTVGLQSDRRFTASAARNLARSVKDATRMGLGTVGYHRFEGFFERLDPGDERLSSMRVTATFSSEVGKGVAAATSGPRLAIRFAVHRSPT